MSLRIISGKFKGRFLKTVPLSSTRPTQGMVREAVFNMCQHQIEEARFLDLFAGSGAMGFEALSRGASHAAFVEENRRAAGSIRENIASFKVELQTLLIQADAARALALLTQQSALFDLIYVDPPYGTSFNLEALIPLLVPGGTLFFEQRYDPKQEERLIEPGPLFLQKKRRFGTTLLSMFQR